MTEQETDNDTGQETGEQPTPPEQNGNSPDDKPAPPWGSDEEFNPEKAWKLIQDLRADKDKLKPLAEKARELEDAQKSEQQKLQEQLETLKTEGTAAKAEAAKLAAALEHGLSKDDLDLLGDGTPEQISERAKRLAERIRVPAAPPASKNQGGPGSAPEVDSEKLAEKLWREHRI